MDFKAELPGTWPLVDHALSRVGKGSVGALQITGPENPEVHKPGERGPLSMAH